MLSLPYKIVIIDDQIEVLEIMGEIVKHLFKKTVEIHSFSSSHEGWEYIQRNEVHVVLSDLHLPGIHGLDLVRQIIGLNRGIRVIAVTGDLSCSAALECFMNGVHGFVTKPATIQKVQETVQQCLNQLEYWRTIIETSQDI